jgi:hypothetical protein
MISLARKIKTFGRLSVAERSLIIQAVGLLAAIRSALWILAFKHVMRPIEIVKTGQRVHGNHLPQEVIRAVRIASRYVPRATCLPRALTAYILLARNGHSSRLHIGVSSVPDFESHAWVECDGKIMVGNWDRLNNFTPILTVCSARFAGK